MSWRFLHKDLKTESGRRTGPEGKECWQAHWKMIWEWVGTLSLPEKFPMLWPVSH